nr:chemotaxis protein CheB [Chloroflexota bacterium]
MPTSVPKTFTQLVVIGASAGGIAALSSVLSTLPSDFAAPVVIAQHLDPHRSSQLGKILAARVHLPVRTVTAKEALEASVVYVVPPDMNVEIIDHAVQVRRHDGRGPKPSVDRLLATASRVYAQDLIAVILTGSGTDGAEGAQAVNALGGTVIVQNPETAAFPSMPNAVAPSA